MDAFIISFLVIAPAEMADKTQLVALFLASRFRKPIPIILGMLAAILVSHLAAGWLGLWLGDLLQGNMLHCILGISMLAGAVWALIPDKIEDEPIKTHSHHSIIITTFISFFIAELGDKTQLGTTALAAEFHTLIPVVLGSSLAMVVVNVPAVLLSHTISERISLKWVRIFSGVCFALLGIYELSKIFVANGLK